MTGTTTQGKPTQPQAGPIPRAIAWALRRTLVRAFLRYSERRGAMLADSITYRALFSLFAGVLLGFSIAAVWLGSDPVAWQALIRAVDSFVPGLVGENGLIDPRSIPAVGTFSVAGAISAVGLVGAAIGAVGSLRSALHSLAGSLHDDLPWYWAILRNVGLAALLGIGLALAAGATFFATAGLCILTDWLDWDSTGAAIAASAVSILIVLLLDTVVIAVAFRLLSGVHAPARALWGGALLGGIGLTVLQQLSGLFVGGATSNPLLVTFAALIALLLWLNLSSQVVLIASSWILTATADAEDRVRSRHGAATFAQRRVRVAEEAVAAAAAELEDARAAEREERSPHATPDR